MTNRVRNITNDIMDNYETISGEPEEAHRQNGDTAQTQHDTDENGDNKKIKNLKIKCLKNILLVGIAGFSTHMVSEVISSLSSSLGEDVVKAMAARSYCIIIGCYLTPFVIKLIGPKYALVIGPLASACFITVFFLPNFILLLLFAMIYGLILGVFYATALFFMMDCTFIYSEITTFSMHTVSSLSNAYLWMMFSLSGLTGNLIVSLHLDNYKNITTPDKEYYDKCGNNFCPEYLNSSIIKPPTRESLNVLIYILIGIAALGFTITCIFLNNFKSDSVASEDMNSREIWQQFGSVLMLFLDVRLLLLLPVIVTHGMVQMFPDVDYSQAYVTCMIGVQNVGYMMACATGSSSIGNFISGSIGAVVRPVAIVIMAFAGLTMMFIALLTWNMNPDQTAFVYLVPAAIGFFDGIARTQISAYTVVIMREKSDAASSAYFMLNTLGHSLIFTWDIYLCMYVKLAVMLTLTVTSATMFTILDTRERIKQRNSVPESYDISLSDSRH